MTAKQAADLAKAGDKIAEMFGFTVATMEAGEAFTEQQYAAARRGIALWHRMRAKAGE